MGEEKAKQDTSLKDLEKDKVKAKTKKLQAEFEKLEFERKWKLKFEIIKVIGFIIAIIIGLSAIVSIIVPLTQLTYQTADKKTELAQIKLDSATFVKEQVEKAMAQLENDKLILQGQLTAISDSMRKDHEAELNSLVDKLNKEKTAQQINPGKITELESRIESKKTLIENTEMYEKQINDILLNDSFKMTIKLIGFDYQKKNFDIFLDDSLVIQVSNNEFTLEAKEGDHKIEIRYNDNARTTWKYNDIIIFNRNNLNRVINKNKFQPLKKE